MLKAIFGVVGLLIVLAIVGSLAKNQLAAVSQIGSSTRVITGAEPAKGDSGIGAAAGKAVGGARLDGFAATAGAGEGVSAQQNIRGVQEAVRDRTIEALQKGAQRSQNAQQ